MKRSLSLLIALACAQPALSATVHVPADYRYIRVAIHLAEENDTILVAPGTYRHPWDKNLDLGDKNLRIVAEDEAVTIDCQGDGSGFVIGGGQTQATEVIGFTIVNASAPAIVIAGSDARIDQCTFTGNEIGIDIEDGSPRITQCTFTGNEIGIDLHAPGRPLTVTQCVFEIGGTGIRGVSSDAQVFSSSFERLDSGISLRANDGDIVESVVWGSTFSNNRGGVELMGSGSAALYLDRSTFDHHQATAVVAPQASLYNSSFTRGGKGVSIGGTSQIRNCEFIANEASSGGAVSCSLSEDETLTIDECRFLGNRTIQRGGALAITGAGSVSITRTVIANNRAGSYGGGISVGGGSCLIESSTLHGNSGPYGGGVRLQGLGGDPVSLRLENTIISGSTSGAAISCSGAATVTATCSNLFGNADGDWGGCVPGQDEGGNLSVDPLYCDADVDDFTLQTASPCAAANSGGCGDIGAFADLCGVISVADPGPVPQVAQAAIRVAPNPIRTGSMIEWAASDDEPVVLRLFDANGRTVSKAATTTGSELRWDALAEHSDLEAGVYFIELRRASGERQVAKVTLVR